MKEISQKMVRLFGFPLFGYLLNSVITLQWTFIVADSLCNGMVVKCGNGCRRQCYLWKMAAIGWWEQ
jgi:hypothetical protein